MQQQLQAQGQACPMQQSRRHCKQHLNSKQPANTGSADGPGSCRVSCSSVPRNCQQQRRCSGYCWHLLLAGTAWLSTMQQPCAAGSPARSYSRQGAGLLVSPQAHITKQQRRLSASQPRSASQEAAATAADMHGEQGAKASSMILRVVQCGHQHCAFAAEAS